MEKEKAKRCKVFRFFIWWLLAVYLSAFVPAALVKSYIILTNSNSKLKLISFQSSGENHSIKKPIQDLNEPAFLKPMRRSSSAF